MGSLAHVESLEDVVLRDGFAWQMFRLDLCPHCGAKNSSWGVVGCVSCRQRCACKEVPGVFQRGTGSPNFNRSLCIVEAPGGATNPTANCIENVGAGAYLLSDRILGTFDTFLNATGIIDWHVINSVRQLILLPSLFIQVNFAGGKWGYDETAKQSGYKECAFQHNVGTQSS